VFGTGVAAGLFEPAEAEKIPVKHNGDVHHNNEEQVVPAATPIREFEGGAALFADGSVKHNGDVHHNNQKQYVPAAAGDPFERFTVLFSSAPQISQTSHMHTSFFVHSRGATGRVETARTTSASIERRCTTQAQHTSFLPPAAACPGLAAGTSPGLALAHLAPPPAGKGPVKHNGDVHHRNKKQVVPAAAPVPELEGGAAFFEAAKAGKSHVKHNGDVHHRNKKQVVPAAAPVPELEGGAAFFEAAKAGKSHVKHNGDVHHRNKKQVVPAAAPVPELEGGAAFFEATEAGKSPVKHNGDVHHNNKKHIVP
jgi:hypothetical protein